MPHQFQLGQVIVTLFDGYTRTVWPDGLELWAAHDDTRHRGQAVTAQKLGYPDVRSMNREHDLTHSLLATWLGLPWSPVLRALAEGHEAPDAEVEEAAVLALQRLLRTRGINIVRIAEKGTQP